MSDELRTSMRRRRADRVIANLDDQSQQLELSEGNDALAHGPFAVFKCARPASPVVLPTANEEDQAFSDLLPDLDLIPDVVDFNDEQFVAALSAIDQVFDAQEQPYADEAQQCDQGLPLSGNPTDLFLTPYLNPYPDSMAHRDASLLLNNYKDHVIRLFSPLKYHRKTPWNILQLPCAMTTLAEITMGYKASYARASVFNGVMAISAFNLSASSTSTAKTYWNGVANSYRLQAHENLKASLEHEMSVQKKAKYKEMLMAILCMVTISVSPLLITLLLLLTATGLQRCHRQHKSLPPRRRAPNPPTRSHQAPDIAQGPASAPPLRLHQAHARDDFTELQKRRTLPHHRLGVGQDQRRRRRPRAPLEA